LQRSADLRERNGGFRQERFPCIRYHETHQRASETWSRCSRNLAILEEFLCGLNGVDYDSAV